MKEEDLNIGKGEEEEVETYEEDLAADIANLTSAFNNLSEIDGELLSQKRKAKLAKMKRQIFDTLSYYCDCLPEVPDMD